MSRYFTDYPIAELGDIAGERAPIRQVDLLDYDGDKYVTVRVQGVIEHIKGGYIYPKKMRHRPNSPRIPKRILKTLYNYGKEHPNDPRA